MIRVGAVVLAALAASGCSQAFRFTEAGDAGDGGAHDGGSCALPGACECEADPGCGAARPRCAADRRCVECLADADCGADAGRCDAKTRRCTRACTSSGQCTADTRNECEHGYCVACERAAQCAATTGICAESVGHCVGCDTDSSCPAATPRCDRRFGTCVRCLVGADCAASEYCQAATGTCAARP